MSFRLKTILGVALIEGVLLAILIGSVFSQLYTFSQAQQEDYARVTLANFAAMARHDLGHGETAHLQRFVTDMEENPDIVYARVLDVRGVEVAVAGRVPPDLPQTGGEEIPEGGISHVGAEVVIDGQPRGRVELGISMARLGRTFERVREQSWLLAGVEMGLVALFSFMLGVYLTRQLKELREAAERISRGELGHQVAVRGHDELAGAVQAFNAMSRQLLRDQRLEEDYKSLLQAREEDERQRLESQVAERTEALEGAGRELRTLLENMPVNIVRYDADGRVIYLSPNFQAQTGIPADRLLGNRLQDLARDGSPVAADLAQRVGTVLATGHPSELDVRLETPQGMRIHQLRMVAERNQAGQVCGVLGVGMDITERREGEARLALMSFAMNQVTEAALLIDEEANIIYANKGAGGTLGYAPEYLIGRNMADIRTDFDPLRWAAHWNELRILGNLVYEAVNRHRDGREIQVEVNATYFEVEGKGYDLALGRDISVRKQLEQARESALAEAERLAQVKSEFLANMSHEIRTPLNAVLGMAQLGMRASRGRRVQSQFAAILDAGQLLLGLVDDILDFSKIEAGRLSLEEGSVDTGQLIDRVVDMTAPRAYAKGLDFAVSEGPDLPERFSGDPLRLSQVLVNLLANAVKFTEAGGVSLAVSRDGDGLVFEVADTGIGMSEEQIDRLFIPFEQADGSTTRRFGGTGLGLAISKRLVDLMGGRIAARGRLGQGMAFRVRIPLGGETSPPDLPPAGRVWLTGPGCALELTEELHDWGVEVCIGGLQEALAGAEGVLLFPYSVLTHQASLDGVRLALARGRRVAVILPPGGMHAIPADLLERLEHLAWPPRSRHVCRLLAGPVAPAPSGVQTTRRRLAGLGLLVAEDNDLNRMILEELLSHEGARVESVENGRQLVERVRQAPDAWDMVITDVQMPEMDGYAATRLIAGIAPGLPVIGLTAHVLGEERERCLKSGMVAHVGKPTQLDVLVAAIREHLPHREGTEPGLPPAAEALPAAVPQADPLGEGAVDWPTLSANFLGREDLIRKGCALLLDNHAATPAQLRGLGETGQAGELSRLAHNIKGMAGNLQAAGVRAEAMALEKALGAGQHPTAALVEPLAAAMERLLGEVADRISRPASPS